MVRVLAFGYKGFKPEEEKLYLMLVPRQAEKEAAIG